ncbi:response regulator [Chlorogloeopsis sp. ULAP01]|uniref:response regulator n=1 Tax=Chlorogloeopsis sp. ULAP01 TaxID=3056483 RepID=UPI0025AB0998|nr:response regulator [Chlorogloeopsis sp. ULAP01]MDM9381926.1 response regulator [Chlorogloeopsis sp. ULAP01]
MIVSSNSDRLHLKNDRKIFQSLDGLRILVVDDSADSCLLVSFILEGYGVKVMTAATAVEALEVIERFKPNLLISDIVMPGVDGYSFIRRVRSLNLTLGKIPAIAVTAMCREQDRNLALSCGFQSYLSKPIDPTDLALEIVRLIELDYPAIPKNPNSGIHNATYLDCLPWV